MLTILDRASAVDRRRPGEHPAAVPVVPIVAGLVSIDQGKRSTIPRPCRSSPFPVVPVVPIVAGLVTSIDRGKRQPSPALSIGPRGVRGADRCRPGDEHRPGEASAVAVVPVVVSIDRVKRQPAPVSIIDQGNRQPVPVVPVVSIVAGAW